MHTFSFQNEKDEELTTKVYMDQVSLKKNKNHRLPS